MSTNVSSGLTSVTGSVNVTNNLSGSPSNIVQSKVYSGGSTTMQTLGTVPAGKIWYVIGWTVSNGNYTADYNTSVILNGVTVWSTYHRGIAATLGGTTAYNVMLPFTCAYPLAAGQTMQFSPGAIVVTSCTIFYVEVAA
jgi:hypothetical protein